VVCALNGHPNVKLACACTRSHGALRLSVSITCVSRARWNAGSMLAMVHVSCDGRIAQPLSRRRCAILMANASYSSPRSEEHTSELQSPDQLVCRLLLEK